jgi:hypothetical protein
MNEPIKVNLNGQIKTDDDSRRSGLTGFDKTLDTFKKRFRWLFELLSLFA